MLFTSAKGTEQGESEGERASGDKGGGGCAGQGDAVLWGGWGAGTDSRLGQEQPGCCEPSSAGSSLLVLHRNRNHIHTLHFKHGLTFPSPLMLSGADELGSSPA